MGEAVLMHVKVTHWEAFGEGGGKFIVFPPLALFFVWYNVGLALLGRKWLGKA